jgi:OmpA-OmpF porin, OOP family
MEIRMIRKSFVMGGLTALSVLASAAALAEDAGGFYVGAGIGQATVEVDGVGFDADDTSFKLFGGYAFNSIFAVELAYFDGGSPNEDFGVGTVEVSLDGVNVSALGRLPLGESFSLFGKLGYASYDAEVTARSGVASASASGNDEDLSYGVGGSFRIGGNFELRAEYEALDISDSSFDTLTLSGVFRF